MDKIMSARVDESVAHSIDVLAKKLKITKKAVIENAIRQFAEKVEAEQNVDILEYTCGSWRREESAADTVLRIREKMRKAQERHKK
jgi:hypothetical protein